MAIKKFRNFNIDELFDFSKRKSPTQEKNKIDTCVEEILSFLKSNDIFDWNDFISSGKFDRFVIDKLIDSYCDNIDEVNEVKFKLRLNLCDGDQLKKMIIEFEKIEEYEKCSEIKKEIERRKF